MLRVLFLGKSGDAYCQSALDACRESFEIQHHLGKWGDSLPLEAREWTGDLIISYLSRWVVPEYLLKRASKAAINFHPGSPEYPGIGCCNFALYNGENSYGATCHHMERIVDTGPIIKVKRVPMDSKDNVASLLHRTYEAQFELFNEIVGVLVVGKSLPLSREKWGRLPYTRKEFDALNTISPDMSQDEVSRRIRSCAYGDYFPRVLRKPSLDSNAVIGPAHPNAKPSQVAAIPCLAVSGPNGV